MERGLGPRPAVEALWLEFRQRLAAFVARRVSSPADVDDIVQTVFLRLHTGAHGIRSAERIHAWLYTTARRAIVDHYRSRARQRESPAGAGTDLEALETRRAAPADDGVGARQEVAACLAPLVDRLAPDDRDAIALTEVGGLRLAQAAARSGVSLSAMKSRVQRARRRLRQAVLACCDVALDARGAPIGCASRAPAASSCCPRARAEEGRHAHGA
jgi:RNA polymerase sigma-70 factor (ECF subfamily)